MKQWMSRQGREPRAHLETSKENPHTALGARTSCRRRREVSDNKELGNPT
jgi:hypothetical protein